MQFHVASAEALLVEFEQCISLETSQKVKFYFEKIKNLEGVIDLTPSYTTVLITFDIFKTSYEQLVDEIRNINFKSNQVLHETVIHEIPVYYGTDVGIDLERISQTKGLSIEEIISLHTQTLYHVYSIGFAPGFAYLGEVNEKIAMPRLESPRKNVEKGSVAIADTQTAIYPQSSPGGWNIVGKTMIDMFNKESESLCVVKMGDKIRFKAITQEEFLRNGGSL